MRINLNEAQVRALITASEYAINPNFPLSDEINARYLRIINKLNKKLREESKNGNNN